MDLFGIKRRRAEREAQLQAEREAMLAVRKKLKEERRDFIDRWLSHDYTKRHEQAVKNRDEELKTIEKINSTCPVCGSKNRIYKFVRTKGEMKGSMHGSHSGYSSLFGGSSYGSISGNVEGKLDTYQVNECKDCSNQWEIAKPRHGFTDDYGIFPFKIDHYGEVGYFWRRLNSIIEKGVWPKIENLRYGGLSYFVDVPRMVIESLLYEYYTGWDGELNYIERGDEGCEYEILHTHVYRNKNDKRYNDNKYLFQLSDEDWDLIKKVLKREEYKDFEYPKNEDEDEEF